MALVLLLVAALLAAGAPAAEAADAPASGRTRLVVVWKEGAQPAERRAARQEAEVDFVRDLGDRRFQLVATEPGQPVAEALRELASDPAVEAAERDRAFRLYAIPNDLLFGLLWGLRNTGQGVLGFQGAVPGADINAPAAWDVTVGIPSTVVAVLDSGYRFEHPDLAPVAWANPDEAENGVDDDGNGIVDDLRGADFVGSDASKPTPDGDPTDDDLQSGGHGIHVAGTIGARGGNKIGITGVAQDVRLMPVRVCSLDKAKSEVQCPLSSVVNAIHYAAEKGARVVNMSFGARFKGAVAQAVVDHPEVLFVAAAGNEGEDNELAPTYPCSLQPSAEGGPVDNLICVAATDQADQLASFSNRGAKSVDLGAPGTQTLSAYPLGSVFADDFEKNDFEDRWQASGKSGGFTRASGPPFSSFGIKTPWGPGEAPPPGAEVASTSEPVTLEPGHEGCFLYVHGQAIGGRLAVEALLDGKEHGGLDDTKLGQLVRFSTVPDAGGELQVRVKFHALEAPKPGDGAWIEAVEVICLQLLGKANGYAFLSGTSMAAPHVSGAAALLFSHRPGATVTEVRDALLGGVDKVPALAGKTATGGRLDAAAALAWLESGGGPGGDGGGQEPAPTPPPPPAPAVSPAPSGAPAAPPRQQAGRCVVPRLAGLTLAQARRALAKASCRLGRVRKPRAKRARGRLVVRSSKPGPRARRPVAAPVEVVLGPARR